MYLGHALYDREASIIHHFAFMQDPTVFKYPHIGAGMALSRKLVSSINQKLSRHPIQNDFSIDASHELSLFILDITKLIHVKEFCSKKNEIENCATFPRPFETCGHMVSQAALYFAVKHREFHKERLPVVKSTWGDKAQNVIYFSEKQDNSIPTVGLDIPNTEAGHCLKTMTIFRKILSEIKDGKKKFIKWIILADDDTILSVSRMRELLSCYNHTKSSVIGERYGYVLHSKEGYNYITGGGGMALTVSLLEKILNKCKCPSPKSPDDMLLGLCLTRLKDVEIIHSPYFHQARPVDYAPEYLKSSQQISFHKHWMIDPLKVYEQWFQNADLQMIKEDRTHIEL
ncbi:LOW QUALITY PROTEIN: beta-1,3-glucosyltransferase-like [Ctenocephalides felis]|uniref:LOW QUALITY PROTEIN: beta-1,3-glucosyltransferase-like n=1 Tax=Ctenocephalides felis TaxID=7515 RepID=UPI000E6E12E4|nr:LOW QUALITY PROTEIN: beta-1,3-glucosyltransferase-like [Ctenocephalides felis]